jgi:hypothetical protein
MTDAAARHLSQIPAHEGGDAVVVDAMDAGRVLRPPQRIPRRGRAGDRFGEVPRVQQSSPPGIAGIGTSQSVGLQFDGIARTGRHAE